MSCIMASPATVWAVEHIVFPVENGLAKIGINSAWKAGILVGVLTAGALWATKPSLAFNHEDGSPKKWALLSNNERGENLTYVPWWLGSILVGYSVNLIV